MEGGGEGRREGEGEGAREGGGEGGRGKMEGGGASEGGRGERARKETTLDRMQTKASAGESRQLMALE